MSPEITIREAVRADIPEILRQRRRMYEDMQYADENALAGMMVLSAEYLAKAMPEGSFHAWLACNGDLPVAGGRAGRRSRRARWR